MVFTIFYCCSFVFVETIKKFIIFIVRTYGMYNGRYFIYVWWLLLEMKLGDFVLIRKFDLFCTFIMWWCGRLSGLIYLLRFYLKSNNVPFVDGITKWENVDFVGCAATKLGYRFCNNVITTAKNGWKFNSAKRGQTPLRSCQTRVLSAQYTARNTIIFQQQKTMMRKSLLWFIYF